MRKKIKEFKSQACPGFKKIQIRRKKEKIYIYIIPSLIHVFLYFFFLDKKTSFFYPKHCFKRKKGLS